MSDISIMNSTYDDYSQRLMPAVPYPIAPGIQTIIDHLAKSRAEAKGLRGCEKIVYESSPSTRWYEIVFS